VEEWLKILKGEVTFFSAGNRQKYPLSEGQALNIPQGEVHRVEIGSSGVTYRMWTPVELPKPFRLELDQDVLQLIERNLKVPEQENQWDRRDPSIPWEELQQKDDYRFLSGFTSEDLIFHTATGLVFRTKEDYLRRKPSPAVWRFSSGCVCILDLRKDEESGAVTSLLLSTVVHTRENAGPRKSAVNLRSFVKESSDWVCRLWLNYLEPQTTGRRHRWGPVFRIRREGEPVESVKKSGVKRHERETAGPTAEDVLKIAADALDAAGCRCTLPVTETNQSPEQRFFDEPLADDLINRRFDKFDKRGSDRFALAVAFTEIRNEFDVVSDSSRTRRSLAEFVCWGENARRRSSSIFRPTSLCVRPPLR
jgi:hypothetical protein